MRKWRVEDSAELYNIGGWGRQYFSVNEKGNMIVCPKPGVAPVDIREVLDELQALGSRGLKIHPDFQKLPIDDPSGIETYRSIARRGLISNCAR